MSILGKNLNLELKKRTWTIAKLSKTSGVPSPTIHGWINGRSALNLEQLRAVATALEVSLYQLVFDASDPYSHKNTEVLKEIFTGDVRLTIHQILKREYQKKITE